METLFILVAAVIIAILARIYWGTKRKVPVTLADPNAKYSLALIDKKELSHDTRRFRFALPTKHHVLGLPVGQHVYLSTKVNGKLVVRPYTPTSRVGELGHVDLVIKVYFKNEQHPKFAEGGKMTQHLDGMDVGQSIDFRGPNNGLLTYRGRGNFAIKKDKKSDPENKRVRKVSMIAGGSGITPMLQVITAVLADPNDDTELALLYANHTEGDILVRQELEECQKKHPGQLRLWYTLQTIPGQNWQYSSGRVNATMIAERLFPPSEDHIVLMCGPPPMMQFGCDPALDKLGYSEELRFKY